MATETLRPDAAGSETSIALQQPSSTYHWDKVDEATADDATTDVHTTSTTYQRDLYNLPAHSVGSGTINFIKIYFRCMSDEGTPSKAKPSLKSDTTVTDGTEISLPNYGVWVTNSQQWNTNPADAGAWSWADIDALQIGVSLKDADATTVRCTQVYVEVDYTLAGWTHITKVSGVTAAAIAKMNSVAVAAIAKVNGVAV